MAIDGMVTVEPAAGGFGCDSGMYMSRDAVASTPPRPKVPARLLRVYRGAVYRVADDVAFTLRVGQPSAWLRRCHARHHVRASAFITAHNPASLRLCAAQNAARHAHLRRLVRAMGLTALEGQGGDPAGRWVGERSLLVLGIEVGRAAALGHAFGQNAILCADERGVPRLVLLR
jgi:Protein of unknown function (DUF3293)